MLTRGAGGSSSARISAQALQCSFVVRRALRPVIKQDIDPKSSYEVSFAETFDISSRRIMTGSELAHLHVGIKEALEVC
jgi:hypothetical protein